MSPGSTRAATSEPPGPRARGSASLRPASALLACLVGACAASPVDVARESIVDGTRETGLPAVYFMYRTDGSTCTAALVSPRVVLTARHCVAARTGRGAAAPSTFRLYAGTDERSFTAEYRVSRVEIIPGSTGDINDGRAEDIALLILPSPARETPLEIARDAHPRTLVGAGASTAVGFGRTPSGDSGVKLRADATVTAVSAGLIYVDPVICPGDSGSPLIGPDGRVYGVASFIGSTDGSPVCGTAMGAYNEVFRHLDWINGVVESVGDGCFPDAEICDGLDNDCNEMVDETCLALGAPCTDGSECVGGLCAATPSGAVCSQECDPMRPTFGCPPSFYCASTPGSCAAFCVPGSPGEQALETSCDADTDCASGLCRDPGDGVRRCLDPCRGDRGDCLDGEVCVASDGACSACVDASILSSPRGLGEVCSTDTQCRSGICVIRDGVGECSVTCGVRSPCEEGFACVGERCIVRREQPVGGPCLTSDDCALGAVCAAQGDRRWCTSLCTAEAPCPMGFDCIAVSGTPICAPMGGLVGEPCTTDVECSIGMCREGACTAPCSATERCGPGFLCEALADGSRACFAPPPPPPPPGSGGCVATGTPRHGPGAAAALLLGLGVALGRRRPRRR